MQSDDHKEASHKKGNGIDIMKIILEFLLGKKIKSYFN